VSRSSGVDVVWWPAGLVCRQYAGRVQSQCFVCGRAALAACVCVVLVVCVNVLLAVACPAASSNHVRRPSTTSALCLLCQSPGLRAPTRDDDADGDDSVIFVFIYTLQYNTIIASVERYVRSVQER